jgi:hypothetical protein
MKKSACDKLSKCLRRAATAILVSGIAAATIVHANPFNDLFLVAPTDLPDIAQLPGDAMLLHDVNDGRTILYVEQKLGAQLAIFDVTDPSHVKSQGLVQLGTGGPFDFVSSLGSQREIVRFRQVQRGAVFDFPRATSPSLTLFRAPDWRGPIAPLGDAGFIVNGEASAGRELNGPQTLGDYKVFDTARLDLDRVLDVKQVRATISKQDTGTTFLLTGRGLYLIRQPAAESEKNRRDEEWFSQHNGN